MARPYDKILVCFFLWYKNCEKFNELTLIVGKKFIVKKIVTKLFRAWSFTCVLLTIKDSTRKERLHKKVFIFPRIFIINPFVAIINFTSFKSTIYNCLINLSHPVFKWYSYVNIIVLQPTITRTKAEWIYLQIKNIMETTSPTEYKSWKTYTRKIVSSHIRVSNLLKRLVSWICMLHEILSVVIVIFGEKSCVCVCGDLPEWHLSNNNKRTDST